ncbi:hypothetical protein ABBQ32_003482 [Trebouxia sp. C0010 RCD-2024]
MLAAASCLSQAVKAVPSPALSETRKNCVVPCHRHAGLSEQLPALQPQLFVGVSRRCTTRRTLSVTRATPQDSSGAGTSGDFNLSEYVEAKVERVERTQKDASAILLKMLDGRGNIMPVFVGENESSALLSELQRLPSGRPITHDLMKNSLEALGYRVTKARITCLQDNTYYARVHFAKGRKAPDGAYHEVDVDARPSDAINMAVRFGAPLYVHKQLASRMASEPEKFRLPASQTANEIARSCKDLLVHFPDPTVVDKLHLQLAVVEERYDDAMALRDKIEGVLNTDRTVRLVVQLEAALHDSRFEEAAHLRDELAREYDMRAQAAVRQKQQLDL